MGMTDIVYLSWQALEKGPKKTIHGIRNITEGARLIPIPIDMERLTGNDAARKVGQDTVVQFPHAWSVDVERTHYLGGHTVLFVEDSAQGLSQTFDSS